MKSKLYSIAVVTLVVSFVSLFASVRLVAKNTPSPFLFEQQLQRQRPPFQKLPDTDTLPIEEEDDEKDVCPDCLLSFQTPTKLCGTLIQRVLDRSRDSNVTLRQAAAKIARHYPSVCHWCDPESCSNAAKKYYRLDDAAPRIVQSHTYYLQSVGDDVRLPIQALKNLTAFFTQPSHHHPAAEYLFEFNPSIVQLPLLQIPHAFETLPPDHPDRPVYLASFRVGSDQRCISDPAERALMIGGQDLKQWVKSTAKNYLGLALLRSDLTVIQDAVVDAKEFMHKFIDARLHVIHGQIYVSSYHRIHPIWIVPPGDLPVNYTENGMTVFPFAVQLRNVWPSNLTVTMRRHGSCTKDRMLQLAGKNLQYFVDADNRTIMESEPMGAKLVVDLHNRCQKTHKGGAPTEFLQSNETLPHSSYGTRDELYFARQRIQDYPYSGEHGSGCCVHAEVPPHWNRTTGGGGGARKNLLLGVSHARSRFSFGHEKRFGVGELQYSSRFYAMEAVAPYRVVARTGRFCFGFPEASEASSNPYSNMSRAKLLIGEEYDCPMIHFVGSMIHVAGDPSQLIVAYGVNDCLPRIVVIEKGEVLRMLFPTTVRQRGKG